MAQPLCVVDVLESRQSPEYCLPLHPGQRVPPILSGAAVGQPFGRRRAEAECAVGEQAGVRSDDRTAKLER